MRGNFGISNPNDTAALSLKFEAYRNDTTKFRGTNDRQSIQDAKYPVSERTQRMQDFLLVSSFGLWAVLLGLSPVLAFRMLVAS
jgi:hypothetical protein